MNKLIGYADRFGMLASALCLVHCLAMPLLLVPLFGLAHQGDALHLVMVVVVTLPVLLALIPGYLAHRRWQVPALGALGLALFGAAVLAIGPMLGERAESALAVAGGVLLFGAHYRNRHHCACGASVVARAPAGDVCLAYASPIAAKKRLKVGAQHGC